MARKLTYNFLFEDGSSWNYELHFDNANNFIPKKETEIKDWTRLGFHQCSHCPLKKETSPQCPIARNLDTMVEDSKLTLSYVRALVTVESPERTYRKECATQEGLRSLFGVIMASSGCPHLDWLRPLTRFHLPFADADETLFRILSLQLLEGYLSGDEAKLVESSKRIKERYKAVETVNHSFINRVQSYCQADADKNAIAALDIYVQLFPYQLENKFDSLRPYLIKKD